MDDKQHVMLTSPAQSSAEQLGRVIASILKLQGVSHKRMAEAMGMPPQTLSSKLRGSRPWRYTEVRNAARLLEVPLSLLWETPEKLLTVLTSIHPETPGTSQEPFPSHKE